MSISAATENIVNTAEAQTSNITDIGVTEPTVNIDAITDEAIVNAAATARNLTLTGTGKPRATVTLGLVSGVVLTGENSAIVQENDTWSVKIDIANIPVLALGGQVLKATQTDEQGNVTAETTQAIVNESEFTRIFGTAGEDELFAYNTGNVQVFGFAGDDTLDAAGSLRQVILFAGPGNDTLIANNNHTLYGGDGDDELFASGGIGGNKLYGDADKDTLIVVEGSNNELYGGDGNDRLTVSDGGGFNRLYGDEGDDVLDTSSGTGNNQLLGGSGNDRLIAGAATDQLFGGPGDDYLFAANGSILSGGEGANSFYLANASIPTESAMVKDFKPGSDRLVVAGLPDLTGIELFTINENADTLVTGLLSDRRVNLAYLVGIQATALVAGRDIFSQQQDGLLERININIIAPVDPEPVDPEPVDPEPVDPEPVDPEPVDPEPVDPEPVDPEPVDPEPVDPDSIKLIGDGFQIIETNFIDILNNTTLLQRLTQEVPDAELYGPLLSFTIAPDSASNPDIFSRKIHRVELTFDERPSEAPDYNTFIKLIDNEFSIFDYNANTGLGAVLRDRDGNGLVDGATLFLKDNAQGDSDPTLGVIRDPGAPSVIRINQNSPLTVTVTDSQNDPLTAIFGTTFKFSLEGSTSSSQVLEAVFRDGTTQTILTTLGDASGVPLGSGSILANLQSSLGTEDSDGRTVQFQLREIGTNVITELTVGDVTPTSFRLVGASFNITAEKIRGVNVNNYTQTLENNDERLKAISLRDLIPNATAGDTITIEVEATLYREAAFDNLVGFYLGERSTGAVVDPLTGLSVAELGNRHEYLSAVRNNSVVTGTVGNNQTGKFLNNGRFQLLSTIDLSSYVLLPFLVTNGDTNSVKSDFSNLYVASIGTNLDRINHIRSLGNNIFGFEDLAGGGDNDFDDIIIEVKGLRVV
ncbi:DUF4114 domain-containing protein [Umezakia ovalisporum]|uniref:DUF4114 domain-containing protein n=1 Tax=Umezakia ovalisporum FSS-43 TaxID=2740520 RepID=A0ABT6K8F5_9CYAN|nr:DUF4114 domain-containing protein [Umezakia ovalisporum]MDH6058693.1 DUF4114 domain-containing protein [Umezakia ovalisporum FSS-43]MDH6067215.1 DUF4114 domain-containing protein [Umezakia ovalisporum APH033B]MDH6070752.1 DUF4114 domain-containing protein [Umezakia ovalisporum CobakiLakeA]